MAWLNPIHNTPWLGLWSDSFAAIAFLLIFLKIISQFKDSINLPKQGSIFLMLSLLPWLQLAFGQIAYLGVAWINFVYLFGFSLAFLIGWNWEKNEPGLSLDFVFSSVLLASTCSVVMQVIQCLFPNVNLPWIPSELGSRFSGSLAHPNLLGTLHIWALLGVLWISSRWKIDWRVSVAVTFWLLIGIALVESRTAWLNTLIVFITIHLFWKNERPRFMGIALCIFASFLVAMYFLVPLINAYFHNDASITYRGPFDSARLDLWRIYIYAILERPWFGYGFGGGREAFVAGEILNFSAWASHTHNLILDVAIYLGVVFAIVFLFAIFKLLNCFVSGLKTGSLRLIVPALSLSVVLVHALFEYPLHYAFFLFPAGLVLGSFLSITTPNHGLPIRPPILLYATFIFTLALTLMTITEGIKAERIFNLDVRTESLENNSGYVRQFVLYDQWDDHLRFIRIPETIALTPEISEKMRRVLLTAPSSDLILKYVEILSANGKTTDAQYWLNIFCKTSTRDFKNTPSIRQKMLDNSQSDRSTIDWSTCHSYPPEISGIQK
jgi:O-antigen ligase